MASIAHTAKLHNDSKLSLLESMSRVAVLTGIGAPAIDKLQVKNDKLREAKTLEMVAGWLSDVTRFLDEVLTPPAPDTPPDYSELTVAVLKEKLYLRHIDIKPQWLKADLVAALESDDAQKRIDQIAKLPAPSATDTPDGQPADTPPDLSATDTPDGQADTGKTE